MSGGKTSKVHLDEIYKYAKDTSYDEAAAHFGVSRETIKRRCREYKATIDLNNKNDTVVSKRSLLKAIENKYSAKELQSIANGARLSDDKPEIPKINFKGDKFKFLFCTDLHMGSIYYVPEYLDAAIGEAKKEKVEAVMISGDIVDGLSNRPAHIYECSHIGFEAQRDYGIEQLSKFGNLPLYMISGNHDFYYVQSAGANIVKDICKKIPNGHYLGHDMGNFFIIGCKIMLWHGLDGNSYATSYRVQQICGSISGGDKPGVLLCGHTHKQVNMFERNIHCFSGGTLQKQTQFMRGKRLAAHTGFWIIELTINKGNAVKVGSTWYPFY